MSKLLEVKDLKTSFKTHIGDVQSVRGVSFHLEKGEALGVVGESGCGKSVTMMTIMRLLGENAKINVEKIIFDDKDITKPTEKLMQTIRGNDMSMIFQDPMTSLNPLFTVGDQLTEHLIKHKKISKKEANEKAIKMLDMVGIPSPEKRLKQYPHEFSGGQRQRIGIARAIALQPKLIICDEPVSALDVSIQAKIINLLNELQEKMGIAYIFISHDLSVVKHIADRVGVMYLGNMMEMADTESLYAKPLHPYTQALFSAIPRIGKERIEDKQILGGDVPSPANPPKGCRFCTRCPKVMDICKTDRPDFKEVEPGHFCACHLYDKK